MATIHISVQSLLNSALFNNYTVSDIITVGTLKTTIQSATNVDPTWYILSYAGNVLANGNTLVSYGISEGAVLMSGNVISELPTLEARQIAKLNLATLDRIAASNPLDTYDISLLPSKYVGNVSTPNPHPTGLNQSRPWT